MDEFEALGPAEKHVAAQLRTAIESAQEAARKLVDALDEIDTSQLEDALIDSKRKETIITLVDPLQKLAANLSMAALTPLLTKVILSSKESATP